MTESNVLANIITGLLGKQTDNVGCPWFRTIQDEQAYNLIIYDAWFPIE